VAVEVRATLYDHVAVKRQRTKTKVGRNEPCPCASGKKFKRCCGLTSDYDNSRVTQLSAQGHSARLLKELEAEAEAQGLSLDELYELASKMPSDEDSSEYKNAVKQLRRLQQKRGLSREDLAEMTGETREDIDAILDFGNGGIRTFAAIAEIVGFDLRMHRVLPLKDAMEEVARLFAEQAQLPTMIMDRLRSARTPSDFRSLAAAFGFTGFDKTDQTPNNMAGAAFDTIAFMLDDQKQYEAEQLLDQLISVSSTDGQLVGLSLANVDDATQSSGDV